MDISYLALGALGASVVAAWNQVKSLISVGLGWLFVTATVRSDTALFVRRYLTDKAQKPFSSARLFLRAEGVPDDGKYGNMPLIGEFIGENPGVYWIGWRPIIVSPTKSNGQATGDDLSVTLIRGIWKSADEFILAARDHWYAQVGVNSTYRRYRVTQLASMREPYSIMSNSHTTSVGRASGGATSLAALPVGTSDLRPVGGWTQEDITPTRTSRGNIDELALDDAGHAVFQRLTRWAASKKWFNDHHVPWRCGVLIHGKPGTGKTSFIRAIGIALDMPVFLMDINGMTNSDLRQCWQTAQCEAPCCVVFEDFDAVFNGRTNLTTIEGRPALDFTTLLNIIDGAASRDGVITFITTNHIDTIDEALTRPGRVDSILEMPTLTESGMKQIANRILSDYPEAAAKLVAAQHGCDTITGAVFQDMCVKEATRLFWDSDAKRLLIK